MKSWNKEEALATLKSLADRADQLQHSKPFSTEHTVWVTKCHDVLEEIFGEYSRYYQTFASLTWQPSGSHIIEPRKYGGDYNAAINAHHQEAFRRDLGAAKGLLLGGIEYLRERDITEVYHPSEGISESNLVSKIVHLTGQLRKAIRTQPSTEKEVQDTFETLLLGAGIPYKREVDRIEYSSKTYIPDFSVQTVSLAIELKLCNRSQREKELPAEINDDILAYRSKFKNMLFVIYDLGHIRDIERFCHDFQINKNITVHVVKH